MHDVLKQLDLITNKVNDIINTKQLKTKPADGIAPTDKFDVRFLINPILFCIFLFATFSLVMFAFGLIISGHEDYLALGDSTLGQVSLVLSIIISFIIIVPILFVQDFLLYSVTGIIPEIEFVTHISSDETNS